ncbi:uncharacterized protein LOC104584449 isoform X6 [Brachypodium distachyon]|nr:uncharacterized protein LOC104584449 isoform X6 [Brachypodium distachyon]|eukprot:XP_024311157.1 uncharacterized protein LOC104584449 isoform X6 [Brachypodium distachyon]
MGEMEAWTSASQGAMRSLPMKLQWLLSRHYGLQGAGRNEINILKDDLQQLLNNYCIEPSEVVAPASMADCWADEVRELSYDIDDFIDDLVHGAGSIKKLKPRESVTVANEILGFRARVAQVIRWHDCYLANCEMQPSSSSRSTLGNWPPPPPRRQQHRLVGMHKSSIREIHRLLANNGKPERKVVSIVGVSGVGKTTLARELYRQLRQQYQCKAFVQASRKPDVRRLLTSILSQVRQDQLHSNWKLQKIVDELNAYLKDKTYFIIIDDLLSPSMWNLVNRALPKDGCCSRILATTEVDVVAQICCAGNSKYIYKKELLSEDESRQLFSSTLLGRQSEIPEHLNNVLYEIINRCGGLPLAVIATASILACQPVSIEQCNYLRNSLDLGLITDPNLEGVKQVLNLGYNSLPHCLKGCMLYLSLYEEDCIIWKDDLMKQWIAEGFICAGEGDTSREETAGSYFDELVNRGMIQPEDINCNDEVLSCTVHRMVHQFIRDKSIEKNFSIAIDDSQTSIRHAEKVRRLGLNFSNAEDATLTATLRLSRVRSLAFSGLLKCMPSIVKFRFLQVLILKLLFEPVDMSDNLTEPDGVSFNLTGILALFRLKYLSIGVSQSHVTVELPTQMQQLKELVALEIQAKLTAALPSDTFDLPAGLLYLRLPSETPLPDSIRWMRSLRTLGYLDLSMNSRCNLMNICNLTNLQELHLTCSTVQSGNLEDKMRLLGSALVELRNLKCLTLAPAAGSSRVDSPNAAVASSIRISFDVFTFLSPPALIERLDLSRRCCIFSSLPDWTNKLAKLCILKIAVGKLLTHDIDVLGGFLSLTALSLYIEAAPAEMIFFGKAGFSVLRYFKFRCRGRVPFVKFEAGAMPKLQKLKLGFNAPAVDQHSAAPINIEHLSSLVEISAKIRGAGTDAESALTTAVNNHLSNPSIDVDLVDCVIYGEEGIIMGKKGEEHMAPDQQDAIVEVENQDECNTQVENKGGDKNTRYELSFKKEEFVFSSSSFEIINDYGEEGIIMGKKGEEHMAPDQQDAIVEVENQDECNTQVENKGGDKNTRLGLDMLLDRKIRMADTLTTVLELGSKIKEVVDKVRHNKHDCRRTGSLVERLCAILAPLEEEVIRGAEMSAALDALEEHLGRALELISSCKERRTVARQPFRLRKISRQLQEVNRDIIDQMVVITLASENNVVVPIRHFQDGARMSPPEAVKEKLGSFSSHSDPELMTEERVVDDIESVGVSETTEPKQAANSFASFSRYGSGGTKVLPKRRHQFRWPSWWAQKETTSLVDRLIGHEGIAGFTIFSFSQLAASTNDFSHGNKIGRGGYGSVYKAWGSPTWFYEARPGPTNAQGQLPSGLDVAIKINDKYTSHRPDFENEVRITSKLQHANIIKLLGCCMEGDKKILVYEYMPNGSLDCLIEEGKGLQINWPIWFGIVKGVAQGVVYLHQHSRLRVIHGDLKPSNVFLDCHMTPRIADFGISEVLSSGLDEKETSHVSGTLGYLDPEYISSGIISTMSDLYAFGVTLLRIISLRQPYTNFLERRQSLVVHAWKLWSTGRTMELIQPLLHDEPAISDILRCVQIALLCVQEHREDRPTMSEVLHMLNCGSVSLPVPNPPMQQVNEESAPNSPEQQVQCLTM